MCGVLCRRYRRRGSNGGGFCVNTSRRGEGFAAPWREQLSFIVERKLPKKAAWNYVSRLPWRWDKQVLRLRARDGEFRAPARVTFFFCKKKVTKENHLDLRSKGPLARGGQVRIWRCVLAGGVQRSSLSVKRTVPAFTGAEASATACLSHGRGICFYRVGEFRRPGGEQVLRLRAQAGAFRAPARVTFFFCKKKVTKENHSNLRFKDPLARGGQVQIWRCWLRGIGTAGNVVGSGDRLYLLRRCR